MGLGGLWHILWLMAVSSATLLLNVILYLASTLSTNVLSFYLIVSGTPLTRTSNLTENQFEMGGRVGGDSTVWPKNGDKTVNAIK